MRILTRKNFYRAFPELDQYDDETCMRYVNRMQMSRVGKRAFFRSAILFIVCAALSLGTTFLLAYVTPRNALGTMDSFPFIMVVTGPFFVFSILWLVLKDHLSRHAIVQQIRTVKCVKCEYSLIGITMHREESDVKIVCPECGDCSSLDELNLSEADINPAILKEAQT